MPQSLLASSYDFSYIEFGTDVRDNNNYHYSVTNKKTNFNTNEDVYGLVKMTSIKDVSFFNYRGELYKNGSVHMHWNSQTFYPNGVTWGHNYDWKNFGKLPAGDYEFRVSANINGNTNNHVGSGRFTVSSYGGYNNDNNRGYYIGPNYYPANQYYTQPNYSNTSYTSYPNYTTNQPNYNQPYYYGPVEYKHEWTYTGTGVKNTNSWYYQIENNKTKFYENENVFVLTKINSVRGIDHFRIKHDFYLNGNKFYRSNELPIQYPRGSSWAENYSWSNFGKPDAGSHKIKIYISINGGSYRYLAEKNITVDRRYDYYGDYRYNTQHDYRYEWSWMDNNINYSGNYKYGIDSNRTVFTTSENVKVLTRLSNIRGIDTLRIRHDLYRGGSQVQRKEASTQYPRYNNWEYNYAQNDFGKLSAGDYNIKVYISVNGGAYKHLDTVNFIVKNQYTYSGYPYYNSYPNYNYDWTVLGKTPYYN